MAMLIMPKAIARLAKMTILAMMATIVMANGNLSRAASGIKLKNMKKLTQTLDVRRY